MIKLSVVLSFVEERNIRKIVLVDYLAATKN